MQDILARAARIKLLIFDVDGVLTDGGLIMDKDGHEYKQFNSRDGHGMKMLQETGVPIAIITGRNSAVVEHRMSGLGIKYIYQGQHDKRVAFEQLLQELKLQADEVGYVGDDIVDLPVMRQVGLAVAVQDAHLAVKKHAHWQTPNAGGRGAARDICEFIMEAQGTLAAQLAKYMAE
jgi:3-deoxy-D-manno-octulosonate 8-phosphate phosphatase (KDO 8-P phosphatase)